MSIPPFSPYMYPMPPYPMYTQRSLPRHVFVDDVSQNGSIHVDLNCSSTYPPMYPPMYPHMYPPMYPSMYPPMYPPGYMPPGHAPSSCGMMNYHPSFPPSSMPTPTQCSVNKPQNCQDDPFAPADENAEWECDSLPPDHCESQAVVELKEQLETLKEQFEEQQLVSHHNSHHEYYEPHGHFTNGEYPEDFGDHYHTSPANITCIYHGATEDTPKEAYILRIPRNKNGHAYAFPKP